MVKRGTERQREREKEKERKREMERQEREEKVGRERDTVVFEGPQGLHVHILQPINCS